MKNKDWVVDAAAEIVHAFDLGLNANEIAEAEAKVIEIITRKAP